MRNPLRIIPLVFLGFSATLQAGGVAVVEAIEFGVIRGSTPYAFLNISPDEAVSTCSRHNQVRWELNSEEAKAMLSIALAASAQGKLLKVAINNGDCLGDAPRPIAITVVN